MGLFWVLADMINIPSVQKVNRRKENHPTKSIKNGITKRRKAKSDEMILPLHHHRAGIHIQTYPNWSLFVQIVKTCLKHPENAIVSHCYFKIF